MSPSPGAGRRFALGDHHTQGLARFLLGEQLADRRPPEERFHLGDSLVEASM